MLLLRFDCRLSICEISLGINHEVIGFGIKWKIEISFGIFDIFKGDEMLAFFVIGFEFLKANLIVQF